MKNPYQKLTERIQPPDGLNERVLAAARAEAVPQRRRPPARRWVRMAVCAACALALVLGTWSFYPRTEGATGEDAGPVAALPAFSFGLTAYAADTGESIAPNSNGALAFRASGEGGWSESGGYYTGCMFQVTGENITTITLSIDRGGLYRYQVRTDLTEEEIAQARQAIEEGTVTGAAASQAEDGTWYITEMTALGDSATETYDSAVSYGFWVQGVEAAIWEQDPRLASRESIDQLDGACLTVAVTFADGSTQTKAYTLSTGMLRAELAGDGTWTLLPALAGDQEACLYGVYAESEGESCFFQWPVQGANTVHTSNSFGGRWQPGGQSQIFHYGIDIPTQEGTPILAAADGTVQEIGFDAERGNYIVLDHGAGLSTLYGQCRDILAGLAEGDTVSAGEMIAAVGSTGMSTGPHLHFEVLQDGEPQDPVAYFDSAVRDTLRMG